MRPDKSLVFVWWVRRRPIMAIQDQATGTRKWGSLMKASRLILAGTAALLLTAGAGVAAVTVGFGSSPPSTDVLTHFSMGGDTGQVGLFSWTTTNDRWALAQSFFVSGSSDWSADKLTVRVREFGTSVVGQEYSLELWSVADASSDPVTLVSGQSGTFPVSGLTAGYWTFDIADVTLTHGSYYAFLLGFNSGPDSQRYVDVVKNFGTDSFPDGRMFYRVGTPGSWSHYFVSDKDIDFSVQGSVVPEPATMSLLGLALVGVIVRRRQKA